MNIRDFVKDSLHKYYIKLGDFFPGKSEVNASNEVTATALIKLQDRLLKLESAQNYTGFLSYLHSNGKVDYNAASDVIGICVIPKSHFGKARFMSVVNMSASSNTGTTNNEYLTWDSRTSANMTTVLPKQFTSVGLCILGTDLSSGSNLSNFSADRSGFLPTDKLHGGYIDEHYYKSDLANGFDTDAQYWYDEYDGGLADYAYTMSPFTFNGSLNSMYHSALDVALSDVDGATNTATIIAAGNTFPAAEACRNFAPGFKDNEWYLPAMGELGYLQVRWGAINEKLAELEAVGCDVAYLPEYDSLWSSSEYSYDYSWRLYTYDGDVYSNNKGNGLLVRAFLALNF